MSRHPNCTEQFLRQRLLKDSKHGQHLDLYGILRVNPEESEIRKIHIEEYLKALFSSTTSNAKIDRDREVAYRVALEVVTNVEYRSLYDTHGVIPDILHQFQSLSTEDNNRRENDDSNKKNSDKNEEQDDEEVVYESLSTPEDTTNILTSVFQCGTTNNIDATSAANTNSSSMSDKIHAYKVAFDQALQNVYTETLDTIRDVQKSAQDVVHAFRISEEDLDRVAQVIAAQSSVASESATVSDGLCGTLSVVDDEVQDIRSKRMDGLSVVADDESEQEEENLRMEKDSSMSSSSLVDATKSGMRKTPPRKGQKSARIITPEKNSDVSNRKMRKMNDCVPSYGSDDENSCDEDYPNSLSLLQRRLKSASVNDDSVQN